MAQLKSTADIIKMREAGQPAAQTLRHVEPSIRAGMSTEELNGRAHDFITQHGAIPAPLGYFGCPKSIGTSINHVICHGVPSHDVALADGDIINVDVAVTLDGLVGGWWDPGHMLRHQRIREKEGAQKSLDPWPSPAG